MCALTNIVFELGCLNGGGQLPPPPLETATEGSTSAVDPVRQKQHLQVVQKVYTDHVRTREPHDNAAAYALWQEMTMEERHACLYTSYEAVETTTQATPVSVSQW